jgi:hypothetical protein
MIASKSLVLFRQRDTKNAKLMGDSDGETEK